MNMFKSTKAKSVEEYINLIEEPRRTDIKKLHEFIQKTIPDLKPHLLNGMIGYGTFHYKSKSGREGDWSTIILGNQKNYISVYVCAVINGKYVAESYKDKLPKASIGKSCIRIKKVSDIDLSVLSEIMTKAVKEGSFGI